MAEARVGFVVASALLTALAVTTPSYAQGHSDGKGNAHKNQSPSSSPLPSTAAGPAAAAASPVAWLDDASVLPSGSMAWTVSAMRWSGNGSSEVDVPVAQAAYGVTRRLQVTVSVPHVVAGADGSGVVGGIGTSYLGGKIALLDGRRLITLAVSPMLEILGTGAAQSLAPGDSRVQVGLPLSAELSTQNVRLYASSGFFTSGVWFAGGGTAFDLTRKTNLSIALTASHASDSISGPRNRRELTAAAAYLLTPQLSVYGGFGHTIATSAADGSGLTINGGLTLFLPLRSK